MALECTNPAGRSVRGHQELGMIVTSPEGEGGREGGRVFTARRDGVGGWWWGW